MLVAAHYKIRLEKRNIIKGKWFVKLPLERKYFQVSLQIKNYIM